MSGLGPWVRIAGLRCRRLAHHIPQLGGREAMDCDAAGRGGGLKNDFCSGRDVHGGDAQNGADTLDFDDDLVRRHARSYGFALATTRRPRPDIRVARSPDDPFKIVRQGGTPSERRPFAGYSLLLTSILIARQGG